MGRRLAQTHVDSRRDNAEHGVRDQADPIPRFDEPREHCRDDTNIQLQ